VYANEAFLGVSARLASSSDSSEVWLVYQINIEFSRADLYAYGMSEFISVYKIAKGDTLVNKPVSGGTQLAEVLNVRHSKIGSTLLIEVYIPKENEFSIMLRTRRAERVSRINRETGDVEYR